MREGDTRERYERERKTEQSERERDTREISLGFKPPDEHYSVILVMKIALSLPLFYLCFLLFPSLSLFYLFPSLSISLSLSRFCPTSHSTQSEAIKTGGHLLRQPLVFSPSVSACMFLINSSVVTV